MSDQHQSWIEFQKRPSASIERRKKPTRTALLSPRIRIKKGQGPDVAARGQEFYALAGAIRLDVLWHENLTVRAVRPATYFGGGQVNNLADRISQDEIELVLVDAALTPIQQRNLERDLGAKVLDRTALILEIFGERAATREGVLQVELAHLNYQRSRLVRSWTHLERQRGGFGFLGGPGETQIEADRRQLRDRIALLEKRIEKVRKTRQMQRKPRDAVPFPLVALVGYTNAGKSTLFNHLTGADVVAKDVLFATLDTTVRKVTLPHQRDIIVSDTVGFIADLPTDLVAAFRATLEEVTTADIILHVRDVASPNHEEQAKEVLKVLGGLGVRESDIPIIEVWNKIDLLDAEAGQSAVMKPAGQTAACVPVSALSGQGTSSLLLAIETTLASGSRSYEIFVPHESGQDIGWLYEHCEILSTREPDETGSLLVARVHPRHRPELIKRFSGRLSPVRAA